MRASSPSLQDDRLQSQGKAVGMKGRGEGGLRRVEIEAGIKESVCIYILSFGPEDALAQTNLALSSYERICSCMTA